MPNSRFALHGLAPPKFTVCAPFLPLIHGLCAFFRPLLTPVSAAPSVHGLHFTVYAASNYIKIFWANCFRNFFRGGGGGG